MIFDINSELEKSFIFESIKNSFPILIKYFLSKPCKMFFISSIVSLFFLKISKIVKLSLIHFLLTLLFSLKHYPYMHQYQINNLRVF